MKAVLYCRVEDVYKRQDRPIPELPQEAPASARRVNLIIDLQERMAQGKGPAYERWAKVYNLQQMAAALQYLRENDLMDYEALAASTEKAVERFHTQMCIRDRLDSDCYMLGKCWTGSYCRYFRESVLPLAPALEAVSYTHLAHRPGRGSPPHPDQGAEGTGRKGGREGKCRPNRPGKEKGGPG